MYSPSSHFSAGSLGIIQLEFEAIFKWTSYAILLSVLAALLLTRLKKPKGTFTLPGPFGLPFVGNLFQLPKKPLFLTVADWSKVYGDCWTFVLGTRRFVVLSSVGAVKACFVEKGATFSRYRRLLV
jgi:hypothetical protein